MSDRLQHIKTRLLNGDKKVFDDTSRWDIYSLFLSGELKKIPESLKGELMNVVDDCRISI